MFESVFIPDFDETFLFRKFDERDILEDEEWRIWLPKFEPVLRISLYEYKKNEHLFRFTKFNCMTTVSRAERLFQIYILKGNSE